MQKISYPELGIEIVPGPGRDTTDDTISFTADDKRYTLVNSLEHQPHGIKTASATLGIKKSGKIDFTVVALEQPAPAAGLFTRSLCPSVTILRGRKILKDGKLQALAVNSGNANVFTPNGERDVNRTAELLAEELGIAADDILICSTGVIGVPLPMEKFEQGIPGIGATLRTNNLDAAASAILTTDHGPKTVSIKIGELVICGMAKGAGMIEPNMATMLVYFFTNARLSAEDLQSSLRQAADASFQSISIDSDTSTSDAVALFSTQQIVLDSTLKAAFDAALRAMSIKLARDIVSQGEGVSKIIECSVRTGISSQFAKQTAKGIINSPLVKAAVHGADPNWGRIVAAIGKSELPSGKSSVLDPTQLTIQLMGETVYRNGEATTVDLPSVSRKMKEASLVSIAVTIEGDKFLARTWGCDLTEEYVTFNSDYTS
ncbi:MAG: bifunctional glutamate N-acetyltransferase/amino-acid acetyltransferase ArgJ [Bdellovibrionota bacterium]